ncbi:MAG: tetratricopeptide repeat protein [Alphaproteobacteria bacterium]|nr:tetratricopeptide repeat protein [Alphaproteobacteria bacterium]
MPSPSLLFLLPLLGTPAHAGAKACQQCCSDAGLYSCPTRLRVTGVDSVVTPETGGHRVRGLWWLDCDEGAQFDPNATTVSVEAPQPGDILLLGSPSVTVECFLSWCRMPAAGCIQERPGGGWALLRCTDGQPLTHAEMAQAGPASDAVYTPAGPGISSSAAPAPPSPPPVTQEAPTRPRPIPGTEGGRPRPEPAPPPAAAPPDPPVAAAAPAATVYESDEGGVVTSVVIEQPPHLPAEGPIDVQLTFDLPEPPGRYCKTAPPLVTESLRQLDAGDEARLAGRFQDAADQYRAALTLDRCSAIAWSAIGDLALRADRTAVAIEALEVATRLRPDHYGALTGLAQAYEARGQYAQARDAYERVLAVRPGHRPAIEGLGRLRAAGH